MKRCLNPFEFRAGIYLDAAWDAARDAGLNPFEFRAGIYFTPMSSLPKIWVLIPLNSGLVFTLFDNAVLVLKYSLNPFEFRAGIYLQ